jgi:hypothetical protein
LTARQRLALDEVARSGDGRLVVAGGRVLQPIERAVTHKVYDKNVLIGAVEEIGAGRYRAPLLLDERVEVLEDHLTGLHIPAVTLLEAARQTWTAVTEGFLIKPEPKTRFVIAYVDSAFESFVFPLAAHLEYQLIGQDQGPTGQTITFEVTVHQNGRTAARFAAQIRVIPQIFAVKQETMAARQALREVLTGFPTTTGQLTPAGAGAA